MDYDLTHETIIHHRYPNGVVSRARYRWSCLSAAQWCAAHMLRPGDIVFYVGPVCGTPNRKSTVSERRNTMEFTTKIRTWRHLDQAIHATGNRMFYVTFYAKGAALKMDNGLVITEKLADAVAHMQES